MSDWNHGAPSIAARLSTREVFRSLALAEAENTRLKARACLLCHSPSLAIMSDPIHGGEWIYCRRCQFGGDVIEFVARLWKLSVEATVDTLIDEGVITDYADSEAIRHYVGQHAGFRQRLRDFWDYARKKPINDSTAATRILFRRFLLCDRSTQGDWLSRGGRIFGITTFSSLAQLYFYSASGGLSPTKRKKSGQEIQSQVAALFPGEGWEELVITPLYDFPGRISGFLAAGRDGNAHAGDYVYLPTRLAPGESAEQELGIGMLSALDGEPSPDLADVVVLVGDPEVAMTLHGMHDRSSRRPLPIVLIPQGRIPRNPMPPPLPKKRLIFWGPVAQLLSLAKRYDGFLSELPIRKGWPNSINNFPSALHVIRAVVKNAVSWSVIATRKAITVNHAPSENEDSGTNLIGVGDERDGFRFPRFSILTSGKIRFTEGLRTIAESQRPGVFLHPPTGDFSAELKSLSSSETGTKAFWAMTSCVLHNLIAHHSGEIPLGVVLDGLFAQTSGSEAAKMLSCVEVNLSHRQGKLPLLDAIRKAASGQVWPSLIRFNDRSRRIITPQWMDEPALRNTILPLDDYASLVMGLHGGFVRFFTSESLKSLEGMANLATRLIPEYLLDLCRRDLKREGNSPHPLIVVLLDLAAWLERLGGDPGPVIAAERLLHFDEQRPAIMFHRLVQRMQHRRDLPAIFEATGMNDTGIYNGNSVTSASIKIEIDQMKGILRRRRAPELDLRRIETDLKSQNAWMGSQQGAEGACWLIRPAWWNETLHQIPDSPPDQALGDPVDSQSKMA